MDNKNIVEIAECVLATTKQLQEHLAQNSIAAPCLAVASTTSLWTTEDSDIETLRTSILGLTQRLEKLIEGPQGYLHEYVSTNWELGALYTLLEFNVLEMIPLDGTSISVDTLARECRLHCDKLLRICRLIATVGILCEPSEDLFAHTAISKTLVTDLGFKSWLHFQLFETRVASAHLADSMRTPNTFWAGQAAFEHAWGMPMYDWHAENPEKGRRFAQAMERVSNGMDPGNGMLIAWFSSRQSTSQLDKYNLVIEVSGKTGVFSIQLASHFPELQFQVQDSSADLLHWGEENLPKNLAKRISFRQRNLFTMRSINELQISNQQYPATVIFILRSALWSLDDDSLTRVLRTFIPVLKGPFRATLLINDLMSPVWGTFEPHIDRAYRRRDVTVMTMHNAKLRTFGEWMELISNALPGFKVIHSVKYTSHSCRGLWEVSLDYRIGE